MVSSIMATKFRREFKFGPETKIIYLLYCTAAGTV